MALKAKKKAEETPVVEQETPVTEESVMTHEEKKVIQKVEENKKEEGANTKRLELATGVVSSQFNLGSDYKVTKFDDKGKIVNMTLENGDFILAVTIKDSDRHGMYVE